MKENATFTVACSRRSDSGGLAALRVVPPLSERLEQATLAVFQAYFSTLKLI